MTASLPRGRYIKELPEYPFARLDARRREMESEGREVIDLGIGDPAEPTPRFIQEALKDAVSRSSGYPRVAGSAELRQAAAGWMRRRFQVDLDPDREILPVNGSKEGIHSLPLAVLDPHTRPVTLVPAPAYPVYALGVQAAGGDVVSLPLHAENAYLPDLDAIPASTWNRTALFWINYPHNPTGAVASREFFQRAVTLCREHGVLLASDEAYADVYYGDPPPSAIECGTENVVVFHTLSKRSAMAGYRTGFLAGDSRLVSSLLRMRPGLGLRRRGSSRRLRRRPGRTTLMPGSSVRRTWNEGIARFRSSGKLDSWSRRLRPDSSSGSRCRRVSPRRRLRCAPWKKGLCFFPEAHWARAAKASCASR